jgi:ABC-2 type transport system permease protein
MILAIAANELRLLLRRRGYGLLVFLFLALLAAAAALNAHRQSRDRSTQVSLQQLVRAQWESQPDRHPHRVAHYGTFAFKPPGPLAAIDPGVDGYAGRVQYLEAHRQNAANFAEAGALSSAFRLGELSLALILQLILPLAIIALGHRTFADEADSGRLPLLLSTGPSRRTLAFGKLLGLAAATAPLLLAAAIATFFATASDPAPSADTPARLALIALSLTLHTLAWLGLTVWISARSATPPHALAVLIAFWIVGNLLLPRAAGTLAARLHPLPDKSSFSAAVEADTRALGDSHNPHDPLFDAFRTETLARHGVSRVEDLPVNWGALVMARGEELGALTFARHFDALGRRMLSQAAIVDHASMLSPSLGFRRLATAAAGTDLRAHLAFQREAEAYRYTFIQQLNALHRDKVAYAIDRSVRLSSDHWARFDDFQLSPPTLSGSFTGTLPLWLSLVLWALVPLFLLTRLRSHAP